MPRQQINYPPAPSQRVPIDGEGNPAGFEHTPWRDPAVHVGWHPGAWVQLGLEVDIDYARMAINSPNGETSDRTLMWTDVLSDAEISRLIDTLKRARRARHKRDDEEDQILENVRTARLTAAINPDIDGHLKALGLG